MVYTLPLDIETTAPRPSRTRALPAGTRVRVVAAPRMNGYFVGEEGTVWFGDRAGAVVTLDSLGVADTRFANVELELV